jgi:hypothetical protein
MKIEEVKIIKVPNSTDTLKNLIGNESNGYPNSHYKLTADSVVIQPSIADLRKVG